MAAFSDPSCRTPILPKSRPLPPPPPMIESQKTGNKVSSKEMSSVVINQPYVSTDKDKHSSIANDHYLILSIILSILSIFTGCIWTLLCSVPAIIYSVKAKKSFRSGDLKGMRENEKIAFAFNIGVLLCWIISFTIVVGATYRELCGDTGMKCNTSPYKNDN